MGTPIRILAFYTRVSSGRYVQRVHRSGPLIAKYLPARGPRDPLHVWSTYAWLGLAFAAAMMVYRVLARRKPSTIFT